jgi:hypothetical protein
MRGPAIGLIVMALLAGQHHIAGWIDRARLARSENVQKGGASDGPWRGYSGSFEDGGHVIAGVDEVIDDPADLFQMIEREARQVTSHNLLVRQTPARLKFRFTLAGVFTG